MVQQVTALSFKQEELARMRNQSEELEHEQKKDELKKEENAEEVELKKEENAEEVEPKKERNAEVLDAEEEMIQLAIAMSLAQEYETQ